MTKCKLIKGLLGATALTAFSAGTAFAQNDFTAAGTTVSNTFTLNYEVNDTPQTQIDNIGNATDFNVDRLVNVTVSSQATHLLLPIKTMRFYRLLLLTTVTMSTHICSALSNQQVMILTQVLHQPHLTSSFMTRPMTQMEMVF